jgi:hypothetical protein
MRCMSPRSSAVTGIRVCRGPGVSGVMANGRRTSPIHATARHVTSASLSWSSKGKHARHRGRGEPEKSSAGRGRRTAALTIPTQKTQERRDEP